jgi:hypothetical protein
MMQCSTLKGPRAPRHLFGISDESCRRLLADQPITFGAGTIGMEKMADVLVLIGAPHDDGTIAMPEAREVERLGYRQVLVLALARALLTGPSPCGQVRYIVHKLKTPIGLVGILRARDEQTMYRHVQAAIARNKAKIDKLRIEGFPPGAFQVSDN